MESLLNYTFIQHAVAAAILVSIACGIVGTMIMEKRLIMMSGGIAHTSFGGIGLGYYLKIEPLLGALAFSLASAAAIAKINKVVGTHAELLIGMFWSLGMALGIVFIALTPGYPPDMSSYLFGDILTVSRLDIQMMLVLDCIILFTIAARYQHFKAYLFDEEFAAVRGIKTSILEYLLYILIACTVVVMIRVVGIILVIALLTAPPAIARLLSRDFGKRMVWSVIWGVFFGLLGLYLSYELKIASGAVIVLVAVCSYLSVSLFIQLGKIMENIQRRASCEQK